MLIFYFFILEFLLLKIRAVTILSTSELLKFYNWLRYTEDWPSMTLWLGRIVPINVRWILIFPLLYIHRLWKMLSAENGESIPAVVLISGRSNNKIYERLSFHTFIFSRQIGSN